MEEIFYLSETRLEDFIFEISHPKKPATGLLLKSTDENNPINDEITLELVYGNGRKLPGVKNSPAQKLKKLNEDNVEITGIWAADNRPTRGTAIKLLFPNLSKPYRLPDVKPIPLHIVLCYDAFKAKDLLELSKEYPGEIMRYGFFTSDIPEQAVLIEKTIEKFESRTIPTTYEEKIVIQLAKTRKDCVEAFCEMGPSYKSQNILVGEKDSKLFFPCGYDEPIESEEVLKKKPKRKGKGKLIQQVTLHDADGQVEVLENIVNTDLDTNEVLEDAHDVEEENEELLEYEDGEEDDEEDEEDFDKEGNTAVGADKATSPLCEGVQG